MNYIEYAINIIEIHSKKDFESLDWKSISSFRYLSEEFMNRYTNFLDWNVISTHQRLTTNFIKNNITKLNLRCPNVMGKLEGYLVPPKKFRSKVKPHILLQTNSIMEYIIDLISYQEPYILLDLDWKSLSSYRFLSEDFMDRYACYLDWQSICTHQKLSEDFIRFHQDKVNFKSLSITHLGGLSLDFIYEFADRFPKNIVKKINFVKQTLSYKHKVYYNVYELLYEKTKICDDNVIELTNKNTFIKPKTLSEC
jgi:hypothetical protein